jgi:hypothetical protein
MIKCVLMAALLMTACGKSEGGGGGAKAGGGGTGGAGGAAATPPGGSGPIAYPDTAEGLQQLVTDAAAAASANPDRAKQIDESLVLPNAEAWFITVFGDDAGKTAYADYAPMAARVGSLSNVFAGNMGAGNTQIRVTKVDDSTTPGASRDQRNAMMAMKTKVPLYRVEMLAPGADLGFSLASFAYVDGAFRFVGSTRVQ